MKFLLKYKLFEVNKSSFNIGDVILIEYWYNDMITPVEIIEKLSNRSFKVSHNIIDSKIKNAPDEIIKRTDIIDYHRL